MTAATVLPIPRLGGTSLPQRLIRGAGWTAGLLVLGLFCGRIAISHFGPAAIFALIGAPILVLIAQRPAVGILVVLVLVSSVASYGVLPRVPLPGHPPVNVADLCLWTTVAGTLWRRPWRTATPAVRRYAAGLGVFLLLAGVATVKTALGGHAQERESLYNYQTFLFLACAVTVGLECSGRSWKPFLNGLVVLAAAVAAVSVAAAASGSVAHIVASLSPSDATVTAASTDLVTGNTARIRLEGLYFVYAMCLPTFVMILLIRDRLRPLRIVSLLLMLAAIGVSLNRNMYAGLGVGLLVTSLLASTMVRRQLIVTLFATMSVVALASTMVVPEISSEVANRASTLLSPSYIAHSGSIQDRVYELQFALPAIARHPWFGVGPLQPYGALLTTSSGLVPRVFVQNLYIDIATDYGIPTALAFLLVPGACLLAGARALPRVRDDFHRGILAAMIGAVLALMLSLLVGVYLQDPDTTAAFSVICGVLLAATARLECEAPSLSTKQDSYAHA